MDLSKERFKQIRGELLGQTRRIVENLGRTPKLAIIQIGENEASDIYIKNKVKTCQSVGIGVSILKVNSRIDPKELKIRINELVDVEKFSGVIVQLPLPHPASIYEREILDSIPWYVDVDGLSKDSVGRLWTNELSLKPATAEAVCAILDKDLEGQHISIINRSNLIGKPLMKMLLDRNASVEVLHSKSDLYDIRDAFLRSDIVITGVGNTDLKRYYSGGYWIDCGIIRLPDGKICGDAGNLKSSMISPVPNGVGTLTTACLARNVAKAEFIRELYKK